MINQPWVPFPDYEDHVTVTQPLFNISPEMEEKRAMFSQRVALSLLLGIGDAKVPGVDRSRMALHLAKLSARVMCRRAIIVSVLDGDHKALPDDMRDHLETAVHMYWIVAQMANILSVIPQHKAMLNWAIHITATPLPVTKDGHIRLPWRSNRLADAMFKHYRSREAFLIKLWDSRFPIWMRISSKVSADQKPGLFGPKDMKGNS